MDDDDFLKEGIWYELDITPDEFAVIREVMSKIEKGVFESDDERDAEIRAALGSIPDLRNRVLSAVEASSTNIYEVGETMLFASLEEIIANPINVSQETLETTAFAFRTWYPSLAKKDVEECDHKFVDEITNHYLSILATIVEFREKMSEHDDRMTAMAPEVFRMMEKYNKS